MAKNNGILDRFYSLKSTGKKGVALLIDPEKVGANSGTRALVENAYEYGVDFIFVGGSLGDGELVNNAIHLIRSTSMEVPLVLFPGNMMQITDNADGLLYLSLISGRNPDLLIGQHVISAPLLAKSSLEVIPTGYMLVDGGGITGVQYISQTIPLPNDKPDLALATALAGKFLGLAMFYLDAGSGAQHPVSRSLIRVVSEQTGSPLIVGGGIDSPQKARVAWDAGADVVVIGNGAEKNPGLVAEVLQYAKVFNASLNVN